MFRYIGNKTKLLPVIVEKTKEIIGATGTVADLMAGTGVVAKEFRKRGYHVIASDIMTYSKHHLATQLLLDDAPCFLKLANRQAEVVDYESVLRYLNNLNPIQGYFYREFSPEGTPLNGCESRKYFTSANAQKIDAIREKVNEWIFDGSVGDLEESVLKHTLIMAVNRVANISGTYGYYMSSFKSNAEERIVLQPYEFDIKGNIENTVYQGYAEDIAHIISADLCYIDPPYMKRQYAANYHILETIARGDFPEARGKSGLRNWWDQHSTLCTKTRAFQAFRKMIVEMDCNHFLISYSEDGLFEVEKLVKFFEEFGETKINEIDYRRFRSNQSALPNRIKEYIIEIHKQI